ncbi:MAG: glycosyltransferase family 4 protein [Dehalococcoidia bacterium]
MRIAMIHTPLTVSAGGERLILRLAIELQKFGHHIEIFVNEIDKDKCYPEMLKNVILNVIPYPQFRRIGYYNILNCMLNIGRAIPDRFDIINNHNFPTEWAAFYAKKRLKVPVVWMCNEPPFWFFQPEQRKGKFIVHWPLFEIFDKVAVKCIDEIVVMSRIDAGLVKNAYGRPSTLIREGVDVEFFQSGCGEKFRLKYGLGNNFLVLQVGSFIYYKHPDMSIKALTYLPEKVKLVLVGPGLVKPYKELASELGVLGRVLFLSDISDEELANIYKACNVCVFPAEQTWGLVVTEAMAAGKPVIVSRKAGVSEIIENNINGIVMDNATPEVIATEIERLIDNPTLAMKMGENALNYVKNNLSWYSYAKNMEKVFQKALSQNQ